MGFLDPGSGTVAGLLRGKPDLPNFQPIDVQKEQLEAIQGNQAALPEIEKLASGVNKFNLDQLESMYRSAIPGYDSITKGASDTIDSMLKGEVPGDVARVVQDRAAAKALGGGFAGSGMGRNLELRDLGLTSLDLTSKGLNSAESWLRTMASLTTPGFFNVSSMFVTPGTQLATAVEERNAKFQHQWNKNMIDWQSSLGYLVGNEMQQDSAQMNSIVGSAAGSAAGAAAGGGGGGGGL